MLVRQEKELGCRKSYLVKADRRKDDRREGGEGGGRQDRGGAPSHKRRLSHKICTGHSAPSAATPLGLQSI